MALRDNAYAAPEAALTGTSAASPNSSPAKASLATPQPKITNEAVTILVGFPEALHKGKFAMKWMFTSIEDATGLPTHGKANGPARAGALDNFDVLNVFTLNQIKEITTPEGFERFLKTKGKLLVVGHSKVSPDSIRKNGLRPEKENWPEEAIRGKATPAEPQISFGKEGCDIVTWTSTGTGKPEFTEKVAPFIADWVRKNAKR